MSVARYQLIFQSLFKVLQFHLLLFICSHCNPYLVSIGYRILRQELFVV